MPRSAKSRTNALFDRIVTPGIADFFVNAATWMRKRLAASPRRSEPSSSHRLWPLLALNFFMADMQSGIGPFVGIFLLSRGWHSGLIGTAMTCGNVAGMLITIPIGGLIDTTNFKRAWVIVAAGNARYTAETCSAISRHPNMSAKYCGSTLCAPRSDAVVEGDSRRSAE